MIAWTDCRLVPGNGYTPRIESQGFRTDSPVQNDTHNID